MSDAFDLFSVFAVDSDKETKGAPTQLPGCGDTEFRICRSQNPAYAKLVQLRWKQNKSLLESKGPAAEAKSDEIMVEVVAKTILVGWKGTVTYKGAKLEYSVENAQTLLKHKDFMERVVTASSNMELFKVVQEAEDAKN